MNWFNIFILSLQILALAANPPPKCKFMKTTNTINCTGDTIRSSEIDEMIKNIRNTKIRRLIFKGEFSDHWLHKNKWRAFPSLEVLHIENTRFSDIGKETFSDLDDTIEELVLRNCRLTTFPVRAIHGAQFRHLNKLDLSHNQLSEIVDGSTLDNSFPNIEYLDISHNSLAMVKGSICKRFPKLMHLDISHNTLGDTIEPKLFESCHNLKTLKMNHVIFRSGRIPQGLFYGSPNIELLEIVSCDIKVFPLSIVENLQHLTEIKFYGNRLECNCNVAWISKYINWKNSIIRENIDSYECSSEKDGTAIKIKTLNIADCTKKTDSALRKRTRRSIGFSPWSDYSACSRTCSEGIRQRFRTCNIGPGKHSDTFCVGDEIQKKKCFIMACPELIVKVTANHILSEKSGHRYAMLSKFPSHPSNTLLIVTISLGLLILLFPISIYVWIYAKILCPKNSRTIGKKRHRKSYYETAKYLMDKAATNWVFMKTKKILKKKNKDVPKETTTFDDIHKHLQTCFETNRWADIHCAINNTDTTSYPCFDVGKHVHHGNRDDFINYDNYFFNDDNRTFGGYRNQPMNDRPTVRPTDCPPPLPKRNKELETRPRHKLDEGEGSGKQKRFERSQKPLTDAEMLQLHQLHNELYKEEQTQGEPIYVEATIHVRKDMPSTSRLSDPYDTIESGTGGPACDTLASEMSDDGEEPLYDTLDGNMDLNGKNLKVEQYFSHEEVSTFKSYSDLSIREAQRTKKSTENVSTTRYNMGARRKGNEMLRSSQSEAYDSQMEDCDRSSDEERTERTHKLHKRRDTPYFDVTKSKQIQVLLKALPKITSSESSASGGTSMKNDENEVDPYIQHYYELTKHRWKSESKVSSSDITGSESVGPSTINAKNSCENAKSSEDLNALENGSTQLHS